MCWRVFRKRGAGLNDDEREAIRHFMEAGAIRPAFVQRRVRDHGAEFMAASYWIRDFRARSDLDYLLHRHKGRFCRRRDPALSLVDHADGEKELSSLAGVNASVTTTRRPWADAGDLLLYIG